MNLSFHSNRKLLTAVLAVVCLLAPPVAASAQTAVGKGQVVDANGIPVIGATVLEVGSTTNGVITDIDGNFEITVPASAQIEISCIGYVTQIVSPAENLLIVLQEDNTLLEETVVIGYGSVKKSDLTSAVASMDNSAIQDRSMARAEQALQGQLAGVTVNITNAEPGADPQIRVRGAASLTAGSNPLYVIDGVPSDNMQGINPQDIESIEVLKDAASAAIYGSRGSNGVVLITTKSGTKGTPKVTFSASYGLATLERKVDVLSSVEWMEHWIKYADSNYLTLYPQGSITDDNATRLANVGQSSPAYSGNKAVALDSRWFNYVSQELRDSHVGAYTPTDEGLSLLDWQDYMYQPAGTQNYNVSVSGATDNTKYMYSLGYLDQNGLFPASNYKRINLRANLETKINDWVAVGLNLAPSYIINTGSGRANGKDSQGHRVLSSAPVSEEGVGYDVAYYPNLKYNWAGTSAYPKQYSEQIAPRTNRFIMQGNAFLRITPFDGFQIEGMAAATYISSNTHSFTNNTIINGNWLNYNEGEKSSATYDTNWSLRTLAQVVANYNKTFGKHTVDLMLGASVESQNYGFGTEQDFKNLANDTITGNFSGSNSTTTPTVSKSSVQEKTVANLASFFGRASYNYGDRYMISASLRYDGYSRFGSKNKWGLFPAVSGGWMVSNEKFFKNWNINWWDSFKIRASYGQTGNNGIGESAAYSTLTLNNYAGGVAYYLGSFGNAELGWEKTHSTDIAADFAFLNNRIQLSLDWYTKTTTDLLYAVPTLAVMGTTEITGNLGSVYNEGFEVELNTHNIDHENFQWDTKFNVSYNQNKVLQLGTENTTVINTWNGGSYVLEVGKPMYYFYGLKCLGVWESQAEIDAYEAETGNVPKYNGANIKPGDLKHEDIDGNGDITNDDRQYLGKPQADFVFGMTNSFTWGNWDASILFTAQTGGSIYGLLGRAIDRAGMGPQTNAMGWWRDAWWSEEDPGNGMVPYVQSSVKPDGDSRFVESSNYFRIKNLTIGYNIPFKSVISSARVYLSIENLLLLTNYYHGYSPETSNGGGQALGFDYGGYPSARTFTLGVNINF